MKEQKYSWEEWDENKRYFFFKGKNEAYEEIHNFIIKAIEEFETFEQVYASIKGYVIAKKENITIQ